MKNSSYICNYIKQQEKRLPIEKSIANTLDVNGAA